VENNVFNHLRHAVLMQAGSNGNVVANNGVYNSFWEDVNLPADAAGDLVLHGNYPFLNLFEQNFCNNIVIDNSHGANGPYNTFLRNRAVKWGVFFSDSSSPSQNILGNEITNTDFPYSALNYRLLGKDHYTYGNLVRGKVQPDGTDDIADSSFAYAKKPHFLADSQWVSFGLPRQSADGLIPAGIRWENQVEIAPCKIVIVLPPPPTGFLNIEYEKLLIYPNPSCGNFTLEHVSGIEDVHVYAMDGRLISTLACRGESKYQLSLLKGLYIVEVVLSNAVIERHLVSVVGD